MAIETKHRISWCACFQRCCLNKWSQRCIKNCDKLESSVHWELGEGNFTLSVYTTRSKNKRKKNVLGLLTMRSLMGITRDNGTRKLVIIKFCDVAKGGRDILDQEISKWICKSVIHMGKKVIFLPIVYYLLQCSNNSHSPTWWTSR